VSHHLLVFSWHNVEGSWCFPSGPGRGLRGLNQQLRFLRRTTNVVPLAGALRALGAGEPLPPRGVAITFDDGYRDNLELAVPLLERLALPATFFLVPGILSGMTMPWWEVVAWAFTRTSRDSVTWEGEKLSLAQAASRRASFCHVGERLKRRTRVAREQATEELVTLLAPDGPAPTSEMFLGWDGARELVRRGFTVGSHSLRHAILSEEAPAEQRQDLAVARRQLEDELSVPVELLAYPNGTERDYDGTTVDAARAAGHVAALTTRDGWNHPRTPPFELRRFVVYPERGVVGLGVVARDGADRLASRGRAWTARCSRT
jgi:peptidoglycan/xylan/chitin deacetylase (PgdA/CDA1 family)